MCFQGSTKNAVRGQEHSSARQGPWGRQSPISYPPVVATIAMGSQQGRVVDVLYSAANMCVVVVGGVIEQSALTFPVLPADFEKALELIFHCDAGLPPPDELAAVCLNV